jgi:hypothetical protein
LKRDEGGKDLHLKYEDLDLRRSDLTPSLNQSAYQKPADAYHSRLSGTVGQNMSLPSRCGALQLGMTKLAEHVSDMYSQANNPTALPEVAKMLQNVI